MLNELMQDLRFIIGAFFLILSVILLGYGLTHSPVGPQPINLNLNVGAYMFLFSVVMIFLGVKAARQILHSKR